MKRWKLKNTLVVIGIPLILIIGISFAYAAFKHEVFSGYTLEGKHAGIKCNTCHIKGKEYKSAPQDCLSCHNKKSHKDKTFGKECEACHTPTNWGEATIDMEKHIFPVRHEGARGCKDCHPQTVNKYTCYECHKHRPSKIRGEHLEEGIRDYDNCVKCHPTGLEHEGEGRWWRGEKKWKKKKGGWKIWEHDDDEDDNDDKHRYKRYRRDRDD